MTFADVSENSLSPLPIHYILIQVSRDFCDLSHSFHKQVTNVSQHAFVILLWGILTSPLSTSIQFLFQLEIITRHVINMACSTASLSHAATGLSNFIIIVQCIGNFCGHELFRGTHTIAVHPGVITVSHSGCCWISAISNKNVGKVKFNF